MNNGKICVSIKAETAAEFFDKIEQARSAADIIEARFDSLPEAELGIALREILANPEKISGFILATFRSAEEGGLRGLSVEERLKFWTSGIAEIVWGIDLETDIIGAVGAIGPPTVICSYHNFSEVPDDIGSIYEELRSRQPDILKIAAAVDDSADAIPLWNLLNRAAGDDRPLVPIAMGEAGKWTRILGAAYGSAITYSAFDSGEATAPGQITVDEMLSVYHVKEIGENTGVYGLLAGDTSYSLSPYIHNAAFCSANLDNVFVPFQVRKLDEFFRRFVRPDTLEVELNLRGFAVTNPHKREIVPLLDCVDETASAIGAVNTVTIRDGTLYGYNTDARGFIMPLKRKFGDLSGARVAVAGTGGAARACIYALTKEGAETVVFGRDAEKTSSTAAELGIRCGSLEKTEFGSFDIVVNATPLGTRGVLAGSSIALAEQLRGVNLVYDLVYNPAETRLLQEARKAGARFLGGLEMLIEQAASQFEIWTGAEAPTARMTEAAAGHLSG